MKKHKKTITINPKYLDNIPSPKSSSEVRQRVNHKIEKKENDSKTYSDLSFKQDTGIHKIIHYLEIKSKSED
jgi:hypothetical protein